MDATFFKDLDTFWITIWLQLAGFCVYAGLHMLANYLTTIIHLRWRDFMTSRVLNLYMTRRLYYTIEPMGSRLGSIDNPDQRIQEDVDKVTLVVLELGLHLLHGVISILSFTVVLWSLMPALSFGCMGKSSLLRILAGLWKSGTGEATSALSMLDEKRLYEHFWNLNLSYVSVGHRDSLLAYHDSILELKAWDLQGMAVAQPGIPVREDRALMKRKRFKGEVGFQPGPAIAAHNTE